MRATTRRPGDIAARYGGEETAVVLPNTDLAGATAMAKKISTRSLAWPHCVLATPGAATT